ANGGDKPAATASAPKKPRIALSEAGRASLAAAKEVSGKVRGLRGPERMQALEAAASAYDKVVAEHSAEPAVASVAAITAADLWRQQGSLPLAEKAYLRAAELDGPRLGQRGLMGAGDMQRRQKRGDEAMATYAKAIALEPGSSRAQEMRLWQARLLQGAGKVDEAIVAFQAALESGDPGSQVVEACNFLALAWIQKGDFDAADRAIDHAEQATTAAADEDPQTVERLKKAIEGMSARKALQRARDAQNRVGEDAAKLVEGGDGK
ncbi:MAG: tetratricopeptide repeat protein, partial [Planctomycetota bacterium]